MVAHKLLIKNDSVRVYCKSIFDKCDKDQDGFVSLEEFKEFVKSNEQAAAKNAEPLTPMIVNVYQRFDHNHDDKIDFEEFLDMLTNPGFMREFSNLASRYIKFLVVPVSRKTVRLRRMHTITGLYEEEIKCRPAAVGMLALSLLQIVFFYADVKDALTFRYDKRAEIWRYVTYMFVHTDEYHLYFNVVTQIAVGLPLEMVHGWRVLVIYCAGALGGSLFQSVIYPNENLVGGSAGVHSFFTAHVATVIMNWREISHPLAQLLLFGTFTLCDPVYRYVKFGNMGQVSYVSHLGGAVCGLLVGVNILRNLKETRAENIIWWISIFAYFGLMTTFIFLELLLPRDRDG
ncbi:rhomboid-related protein 3-like [Cylas formicarius]|uniref:rhomboid-related protein 3-like n=1 Tax=Cylas formicarius TaxID=197179 RepID=UPI00295839C7|nr:rhomboid-related protein 3-like [Cylas formicarius]